MEEVNEEEDKEKNLNQRYKGSYRGIIVVEANVRNKYKTKSRSYNGIKIARDIHRVKIPVEIKNIGFNRSEIFRNSGC